MAISSTIPERLLIVPADICDGVGQTATSADIPFVRASDNTRGAAIAENGAFALVSVRWPGESTARMTLLDLVNHPFPVFTIGGTEMTASLPAINGYPVWRGGGFCLFRSTSGSFVCVHGTTPFEPGEWTYSDGTYAGDDWYVLNVSDLSSISANGRGGNRNATSPVIAFAWPRWELVSETGSGMFGAYAPLDGATGSYRFGFAQYIDGDRNYWTETVDGSFECSSRGLTLSPVAGNWITNAEESTGAKYMSDSPPSRTNGCHLTPFFPAGTDWVETPPAIDLTFRRYVSSGEKIKIRMGEIAQWR